ncbi:MAG: hypothetical protein V4857_08520 [Pseudomonadota bacterium]
MAVDAQREQLDRPRVLVQLRHVGIGDQLDPLEVGPQLVVGLVGQQHPAGGRGEGKVAADLACQLNADGVTRRRIPYLPPKAALHPGSASMALETIVASLREVIATAFNVTLVLA